jgi:TonB family protein
MKTGRLIVMLWLLAGPDVSAWAAQAEWVEAGSEHFVLYTDTGAEKGRLLLEDLEARYAAFASAFGSLQPRPFRIRVFLMDDQEEFADSVPESSLKTIGTRRRRLVASESAYLVFSATGTFIVARDQDPSSIADDVAHSLGHLLLARSTLWHPFWLQEGVGEYLRRLGRGNTDGAVSRKDGFSVPDLLTVVPSGTYDDLEDGGPFRKQSYHLLRVLTDNFPDELEAFLQALRADSGRDASPSVPVDALGDLLFSYVETSLALTPVVVASDLHEMSAAELATNRGDLLLSIGRPQEAAVLYDDNPTAAARIGETILAKIRRETPPVRRSFEQLVLEFPDSGLAHYHMGTLRASSEEERSSQIAALERAIELMPQMGRAYAGLGALYVSEGRPAEALPILRKAIELEPEFADGFFEILADARMQLGDYEEAGEAAGIAAALVHSDPATFEHFDLLVPTFYRKMELHRRAVEAERVEQLRREVEALADKIDPRPAPVVEEPAPVGRIILSVSSGTSAEVTSPVLISSAMPDYTADLRRQGAEGRIVLQVDIDRRGNVEDVKVRTSDIHGLDVASVEAVRGWVFQPARRNHESIPFSFRLTLRFYLE